MSKWMRFAVVMLAAMVLVSGAALAKDKGEAGKDKEQKKGNAVEVSLADLPEALKTAITKAVDEEKATMGKILKAENKKDAGKFVYLVHLTKDGKKGMMVFDEAGTIVKPPKYRDPGAPKDKPKKEEK